MTKKYYGVWNVEKKKWWPSYDWKPMLEEVSPKIKKIIGNIPLWDDLDFLKEITSNWESNNYEIREFTPQDALLVRCGKI